MILVVINNFNNSVCFVPENEQDIQENYYFDSETMSKVYMPSLNLENRIDYSSFFVIEGKWVSEEEVDDYESETSVS